MSKGIEYTVRENMIYFSLDKPGKFSIEINENRVNNLHVFANEPETEVPNPDDPGVVYFAPGFHRPKDLPGNAFYYIFQYYCLSSSQGSCEWKVYL